MTTIIPYLGKYTSEDDYVKIDELGKGGFATLYSVYPKHDKNCIVAMKVIQKRRLNTKKCKDMIKKEIKIHSSLLSPYIPKFLLYFENERNYYIILEYAKYGDLFSEIQERFEKQKDNKSLFSKAECFEIIKQICQGLQYIHSRGYLHRDLKSENVLIFSKKPWIAKVSDFGHSHKKNKQKGTFGPTLHYISIEELGYDEVDEKSEVWKVGVLLYEMVYGECPFTPDSDSSSSSRSSNDSDKVMDKIASCDYKFPDDIIVPRDIKKLIKKCLREDAKDRISIDEIIEYCNKN